MIILHAVSSSMHGTKMRTVLRHKELGALVKEEAGEAVPCAAIPRLLDGDVEMTDPDAMADHLERSRPSIPMVPDTPETQGRERALAIFLTVRLEPVVTALATLMTGDRPGVDATLDRGEAVTETLNALAKMVDRRGRKRGGNAFLTLRSEAVPLLLGDCGYPAAFAWVRALDAALDTRIVWPGAVLAYEAMLEERTAVAETMKPCRAAIDAWIEAHEAD